MILGGWIRIFDIFSDIFYCPIILTCSRCSHPVFFLFVRFSPKLGRGGTCTYAKRIRIVDPCILVGSGNRIRLFENFPTALLISSYLLLQSEVWIRVWIEVNQIRLGDKPPLTRGQISSVGMCTTSFLLQRSTKNH